MEHVAGRVERLLQEAETAAQRRIEETYGTGGRVSPARKTGASDCMEEAKDLVRRICDKEDRVARAEAQAVMLRQALDAQETTIKALQDETQQRTETTQHIISDLETRLAHCTHELSDAQRRASDFAAAQNPQMAELHTLRLEVSQLNQELLYTKTTHAAELLAKTNQLTNKESEVQHLTEAMRSTESSLRNMEMRNEALTTDIETMRMQEEQRRITSQSEVTAAAASTQIADAAKIAKQAATIAKLKNDAERLRHEAHSSEKLLTKQKQTADTAEAKHEALKRKLAKLDAINLNLKQTVKTVTAEAEYAHAEKASLMEKLRHATVVATPAKQAEDARVQLKLDELNRAIQEQQHAAQVYTASKAALESQNHGLTGQVAGCYQTITTLTGDLEKYSKDNYVLREEKALATQTHVDLTRALGARGDAERRLMENSDTITRLTKEMDNLRTELAASRAEAEALVRANEQSKLTITSLREDIVSERSKIITPGRSTLTQDLQQMKIAELERELVDTKLAVVPHKPAMHMHNTPHDAASSAMTQMLAEIEFLKQANDQAQHTITGLRGEVLSRQQPSHELQHLQETLASLACVIREQEMSFTSRLEAYKVQVSTLTEALEEQRYEALSIASEAKTANMLATASLQQDENIRDAQNNAAGARLSEAMEEVEELKGKVAGLEAERETATETATTQTKLIAANSMLLRSVWDVSSTLSTARETLLSSLEESPTPEATISLQTALKAVNSARSLAQNAAASQSNT
eukprot:TRINITY_DN7490_c0_g1_i1.p1 TRINITY_DN7490_c0_g1~~TRINITY_DN7490_c0_g1_i1.p1  ORF type:complete len:757 (+),score=224.34 TRINITY_DN7490_c0_g1_i1:39-2309(+)